MGDVDCDWVFGYLNSYFLLEKGSGRRLTYAACSGGRNYLMILRDGALIEDFQEVCCFDDLDASIVFQTQEMFISGNNVFGLGGYSTLYEFVIIRVCVNDRYLLERLNRQSEHSVVQKDLSDFPFLNSELGFQLRLNFSLHF